MHRHRKGKIKSGVTRDRLPHTPILGFNLPILNEAPSVGTTWGPDNNRFDDGDRNKKTKPTYLEGVLNERRSESKIPASSDRSGYQDVGT